MMNMVLIPDWVLRAVRDNGAPMETVLDAFALSNILSPRDVGFYLASTEALIDVLYEKAKRGKPGYHELFGSMPGLHINNLDWIQDAVEVESLDDKTHERLVLIRENYREIMGELYGRFRDEDTGGRFKNELFATLWREPSQALAGKIPEDEKVGIPGYIPELNFFPIVIRNPETLRRTGLDKDHLEADQPAGKVVVIGAAFSPAADAESPQKVALRAHASLMSILGTFMPTHRILDSGIMNGYIDTFFYEKRMEGCS